MRAALACGLGTNGFAVAPGWAPALEAGDTTGRTGQDAVALPGVYCQQWRSQGTGTQTPCGPDFRTPVAGGAGWAALRLQDRRATPVERDWYGQ